MTPEETIFIGIAVLAILDDLRESDSNQYVNWTPEARKYHRDMMKVGGQIVLKLRAIGIDMSNLPDFKPGDESEFLTKES